jgi:hypothetical protein
MLGLDDLEFTGPKGTQGGMGGDGQSSGMAGEPTGGASGGNAGQGACGSACTGVCLEGVCCPTGHANCGGECFDLRTSAGHCGSCETSCGAGEVCLEGVCCPEGHANCGGECFDLRTSAGHCGSCETTCAAGEVCRDGRCKSDCGGLDQCGTECVDLASNPNHCQRCGNECPAPPNGTAVCYGACDIRCIEPSQRCGNSCCPPPPSNGQVVCSPGDVCQVQCNANHHACEGTETPCFPDEDAEHCGTSCEDCRQPNAIAFCVASRCANFCYGLTTFPCGDLSGKVACGFWDFESGTNEGWYIDPDGMMNAWTGTLEATQARTYSGTNSLAFGFDGDGNSSTGGSYAIELGVSLCPNGVAVDWPPRGFGFYYSFEPASGFGPPPEWTEVFARLRNGKQHVLGVCDTPQDAGSGWEYVGCAFADSTEITHLSFGFRIFVPWKGTIYIDFAQLFLPQQ